MLVLRANRFPAARPAGGKFPLFYGCDAGENGGLCDKAAK